MRLEFGFERMEKIERKFREGIDYFDWMSNFIIILFFFFKRVALLFYIHEEKYLKIIARLSSWFVKQMFFASNLTLMLDEFPSVPKYTRASMRALHYVNILHVIFFL